MIGNAKKTLLVVTPYFPPQGGGLENYALHIAKELETSDAFRVVVVTSGEAKGEDRFESYEGLLVYRLSYDFCFSRTPFSFRWFRKVRQILKEEKPEIVNVHMPVPGIADVATLMTPRSVPVVVTYHGNSMKKGSLLLDPIVALYEHTFLPVVLRKAKHIICASDATRNGFLFRYRYKSTTITPGVDAEHEFTYRPELKANDPTVVFAAANLDAHKGLSTLLDAFAGIVKEIPNARLSVIGDGPRREQYESLVSLHGLKENVIFKGQLSGKTLVEEFQKGWIFALPTSNDSSPMVVIEAMACGLPVVSTRVGGIPVLVDDEKTGVLVEPKDFAVLSKKILDFFGDHYRMKTFGEAGRKKVAATFGWKERAQLYTKILDAVTQVKDPLIVQVSGYYPPHVGGVERVVQTLSQELSSKGRQVLVLTSSIGGRAGVDSSAAWTVKKLRSFEFAHTPVALSLPWHLLTLPKRSVIHLHLSQAYWPELVLCIASMRRIPYIVHFHLNVGPSGVLGPLFLVYKKLLWGPLLRHAKKVIVFSTEQQELVQDSFGVSRNHIEIVPNGVGKEYFSEATRDFSADTLQLLYVGRLAPQKKVERLIQALSHVRVDVHLTVVGDGEDRKILEAQVQSLNTSKVSFVGFQSEVEVAEYYRKSHALVISSEREGMPLTVLEAMASGLPVVGSDVIGIRELVDGIGILVKEPYAEGFASVINTLHKNEEKLETLSRQSVAQARRYSWSELVVLVERIYEEVIV